MNLRESVLDQKSNTNVIPPQKIQQLREIAALVIEKSNRTISLINVKNCTQLIQVSPTQTIQVLLKPI
jgi:hypothetical protein